MSKICEPSVPCDADAEEAVLGSVMIVPDAIYSVNLAPSDFYVERNGWIWRAMQKLAAQGKPIDYLTISSALRDAGKLDELAGNYITALLSVVPTALHVQAYAERVKKKAVARALVAAAGEIAGIGYDSRDLSAAEMIARASGKLLSVDAVTGTSDGVTMDEAAGNFLFRLQEYFEQKCEVWGIPTKFDLDKYLGGLHKKELLVLSGDPKVGKTSFLIDIALNVAESGARVAFFSLEMSENELLMRMVSNRAGVDSHLIKCGLASAEQQDRIIEVTRQLKALPIRILDKPTNSDGIQATVARLKRTDDIDVVIVDYSKLLLDKGENESLRLGNIARNVKNTCKEYDVSGILVHPVTRTSAQQARRPVMGDLGWSWDVVYHCDALVFLWKDPALAATDMTTEAIIAANRNGPALTVPLVFDKSVTRWGNLNHARNNPGTYN